MSGDSLPFAWVLVTERCAVVGVVVFLLLWCNLKILNIGGIPVFIFLEVAIILIVVISRVRLPVSRKSGSQSLFGFLPVEHCEPVRWKLLQGTTNIRAPRRGTLLTTCPFTNSAFGFPTCLVFKLRLEKTQNLVSTNVPDVIESLRASCSGIGMVRPKW